ncbi:glycoside hydrolase family 13 protein [Stackebrandtia nassauensis]|uniref:Alpha amylase catalytic region n=1 Tax=Stackebrandtia nassauensis (strain DSM 44728 / CIP 108903 / NRRL B-16338 / NBRC 102104 / LLR-40K-21) TaxID=446470 RepID=D3PXM2_STANL|nr:glycoside hydrolase family 13 protein [Stackebrandtia nassauensis]ADD43352.1 alpha amylase catalytic region [Stackebrandtia nassauensis DSM 44728]
MTSDTDWAKRALIYQVYVRSFADSDGDGLGDLAGVRSRLDHIAALGADAIWLTPFYPSPMVDGGYDVADYRDVDPRLGTLADFDALLSAAHDCGIRVITDIVPNHTSHQHPWFRQALTARPGSSARARYIFRPGRGPDSVEPPNNWQSVFGGPAWTRLPDGDWYLHLFAPEQPDLNWDSTEVRAEFVDVLRFWLDRGVDGIRVDVAHGLVKPAGLPDATVAGVSGNRPYFDQDGVHEIYREWRKVLDSYAPTRIMVAEARLRDTVRTARYVRPDEMDQAFNFEFLWAPWSLERIRDAISRSLTAMNHVGRSPTWVIGNHDEIRVASRLAADVRSSAVGLRRARAMALLSLALPGSAYIYQGDELGLPQAPDLAPEFHEDPKRRRSAEPRASRDECRIPMPWHGDRPPFGFGPDDSTTPWLPQPEAWARLTVAAQQHDPDSTLTMYQQATRLRQTDSDLTGDDFAWKPAPSGVLAFTRGQRFTCAVNFGPTAVPLDQLNLPENPLLCSTPIDDDALPANAAIWSR